MLKGSQLSQRLRHPTIVGLTLLAFVLQPLAAASSSSCRRAAEDGAAHERHQDAVSPQDELQSEVRSSVEAPSCHATAPAVRPSSQTVRHAHDGPATAPAEAPSHEDCSCCDDACCCVTAPPPAKGAGMADITPPDDPSRVVVEVTVAAEAQRRLDTLARGPPTD